MTNEMIVFNERCKLMDEGILAGTGRTVKLNDVEREEPEELFTYQAWKSLGYQVQKGEKAIAKITIWKYRKTTKENEKGEEEEQANMFLTTASFFKKSQVKEI